MDFEKGEVVEWSIEDKKKLILTRNEKVPNDKRNLRRIID